MARKLSAVGIVFGIINILVALVPPTVNTFGIHYIATEPPIPIVDQNPGPGPRRQVDLGPPIWQHIRKELPAYKPEYIGASLCNAFLSFLLIGGAVGLFLNHDWGRWLSVGVGLLMLLTFCIHDVYQLAIVRPSLAPVVERTVPGPAEAKLGGQIGFTFVWYFWCWVNLALMIYLLAMAVTLSLTRLLGGAPAGDKRDDRRESRRRRDDDYTWTHTKACGRASGRQPDVSS